MRKKLQDYVRHCVAYDSILIKVNNAEFYSLWHNRQSSWKINFMNEKRRITATLRRRAVVPDGRTDIRDADESAALHNSSTGHSSSRPVGRKQTLNAWWGQKDSSRTRS